MITAAYASVRGLAGHVEEYGELAEEVNRLGIEIGDRDLRRFVSTSPGVVQKQQERVIATSLRCVPVR